MGNQVDTYAVSGDALVRKSLRRDITKTVLLLLSFYFAMSLLSLVIAILPALYSKEFIDTVSGFENDEVSYATLYKAIGRVLSSSPSAETFAIAAIIGEALSLPLFIILRGRRMFASDVVSSKEKMRASVFPQLFAVALGAQFVFTIFAFLIDTILRHFNLSAVSSYEAATQSMMNFPGLLYIMLLGPIMEELVFRAAIMKTLEKYGENFAIIVSALFFACYHIFLVQAVFAFPIGILFGYTASRYSVKWSMLLHILYNSTSVVIGFAIPNQAIQTGIFLALMILAIILLVIRRSSIRRQKHEGAPKFAHIWSFAFSGVSMILFLAVFVVFSALSVSHL